MAGEDHFLAAMLLMLVRVWVCKNVQGCVCMHGLEVQMPEQQGTVLVLVLVLVLAMASLRWSRSKAGLPEQRGRRRRGPRAAVVLTQGRSATWKAGRR